MISSGKGRHHFPAGHKRRALVRAAASGVNTNDRKALAAWKEQQERAFFDGLRARAQRRHQVEG